MKGLDLVTPEIMSFNKHVFHPYVIRIKERDRLIEQLTANNMVRQYIIRFQHYKNA
jgi:dTDP-4-amino-4,6-dideoxygalactose transaminase